MKNPNAVAAAIGYGVSMGVQWLTQRYAHVGLSDYWKQTIDGGVTVAILYVGSAGLKNALQRLWAGPKKLWSGEAAAK